MVRRFIIQLVARLDSLFPDANEVRLIEILGGKTLTFDSILSKNGNPLTLILSRGKAKNYSHRLDLGQGRFVLYDDCKHALAIQGDDYQYNVVKYQELGEKLRSIGLLPRFVPEKWLWQNPNKVQQFLA